MNILISRIEILKQYASLLVTDNSKALNANYGYMLADLSEEEFKTFVLYVRNQDAEDQRLSFTDKAFLTGLQFVYTHSESARSAWIAHTDAVNANPNSDEDYRAVISYWAKVYGIARGFANRRNLKVAKQNATINPDDPRFRSGHVARRIIRNPWSRSSSHHARGGHS